MKKKKLTSCKQPIHKISADNLKNITMIDSHLSPYPSSPSNPPTQYEYQYRGLTIRIAQFQDGLTRAKVLGVTDIWSIPQDTAKEAETAAEELINSRHNQRTDNTDLIENCSTAESTP